jgi:uncharacterized protein
MKFSLRSFSFVLAILACAGLSLAQTQQQKFPPYSGHVNDFANVLNPQTKEKLELWLTNFEKMTGTQIAVVTVTSLEGRPIEEYANGLYRAWGIGAKTGENKDKGALLLVAVQDRQMRLEVGYGLEGDLPDGLAGEIIRRMRPDLQQGRFSEAMTIGVRTLLDTLAEKWNINIAGIEDHRYAYRSPTTVPIGGGGLLCLLLGAFLFSLFISAISRGNRRGGGRGGRGGPAAGNMWWLFPIIFGSGGGTFGGGSWGNTGGWNSGGGWGGGGWGGFGGGSSGGGGASGSW